MLSNHDVVRHVTRYGRAETAFSMSDRRIGVPSDLELGTRRARAAALLTFSLPGGVYIYQGDELGLPEVEDLPDELLQDPIWERSRHTDRGRDGCRVPLPWSGACPPFGFGPDGTSPWLPQPADWKDLTAEAQAADPGSMLGLYRRALRLRRAEPALADGTMTWLPAPDGVLSYSRGGALTVVVNLSACPVPLPAHTRLLIASGELRDGLLPPDTAAWLRAPGTPGSGKRRDGQLKAGPRQAAVRVPAVRTPPGARSGKASLAARATIFAACSLVLAAIWG